MEEFQEFPGFPSASKLDMFGKLDPKKATPQELHGRKVFFGKGQCSTRRIAPDYTDNPMHGLHVERFHKAQIISRLIAPSGGAGPLKTQVLRGAQDLPTYLHDGRLMTLDYSEKFFNPIPGTKLTSQENKDFVAFLLTL